MSETTLAASRNLVFQDNGLFRGSVAWILVHWQNRWYFPAFNLADSAITVGAVMLALDMFRSKKSGEAAHG